MKKVNTHGLVIKGLRAACQSTLDWRHGYHTQLCYNVKSGEVFGLYQTEGSYRPYEAEEGIITVARATEHMTMQEIADAVYKAVCDHREHEKYIEELVAAGGAILGAERQKQEEFEDWVEKVYGEGT